MPALRPTVPLWALLVSTAAAAGPKSCPANVPLSCHENGPVKDTCCSITAGQLVQTQFWDTDPVTGPSDSWTIHGLWPDNCDGTFPASCDSGRAYGDIGDVLSAGGAGNTLSFMKRYWKDNQGDDEKFWQHEWTKHGTCVSTLAPDCYEGYRRGEEAVDYFARTVELFESLPTYEWLAAAGIYPDRSRGYSAEEVQAALSQQHGAPVTLGCKGKNLNEVWYHFNVRGSLQSGQFVATHPDGAKGTCGKTVYYQPKGLDGERNMYL